MTKLVKSILSSSAAIWAFAQVAGCAQSSAVPDDVYEKAKAQKPMQVQKPPTAPAKGETATK